MTDPVERCVTCGASSEHWQPQHRMERRQRDIAALAEDIHAEHHAGYFVPSLDSCPEHDRAEYEAIASRSYPQPEETTRD